MAIIKGKKYHPPEEEPRKASQQEQDDAAAKKGGLIKARYLGTTKSAPPTNYLQESLFDSSMSKDSKRSKKVLKASDIAAQRDKDSGSGFLPHANEIFGDASDYPDQSSGSSQEMERKIPPQEKPQFKPAAFFASSSSDGQLRDVVMIPSRDKPAVSAAMQTRVDFDDDEDFHVASPESAQMVDTQSIVAEAEQKGREKAQKIIEHAQAEAKKLIDQAKVYGETAKQEAHKEGFKLGKEDGYKAGYEEFAVLMNEAKNLIGQAVREREAILRGIEPELAKLSLSIAEKILTEELKINPEIVVGVVKKALGKIKAREEVTINVNPEDLEYVKENRQVFAGIVEGLRNLEIVSNPRVDRGGCLIETNLGNTDARISTQLAAIEAAFKILDPAEQ